jgi:hypothetical protein
MPNAFAQLAEQLRLDPDLALTLALGIAGITDSVSSSCSC